MVYGDNVYGTSDTNLKGVDICPRANPHLDTIHN